MATYIALFDTTSPQVNLAREEYLLKNKKDDYILLWKNEPSVIIGKNQNTYAEVNLKKAEELNVHVVRRITGGGAVYHDLGNLNYTFITDGYNPDTDFKTFSLPVCEYLKSIGLNATFSGRNDILIDGMKISGTAVAVENNRTMYHGTLMFDVNLSVLGEILIPSPLKLQSRGISSVKSRVTNIKEHTSLSPDEFINGLFNYLKQSHEIYIPTTKDTDAVIALANSKYSSWDWNVGQNPKYSVSNSKKFDFGIVSLDFDVYNGVIDKLSLTGDFFGLHDVSQLCSRLCGIAHTKESLITALCDVNQFISGATPLDIAEMFF